MSYAAASDRYDQIRYRRCGRSGLKLPEISLGLWQNFGSDRPLDLQRAIVLRAFDLGVTHFDLANNYGGRSLGASDDPVGVARRFKPDLLQAPASLLDQRLLLDGSLMAVREMGIEVHLRSIFLNGLLFLPPDRVPAQLKGAAGRLSRARRMIAEGRSDPLQAALGFALSRPEADAVIVGASSAAELSAVIAAASSPPPDLDWDEMAIDDPIALDPDRWAAA